MRPPSKKQLSLIACMEELLVESFKGTTMSEASAFITKYMEAYQEEKEFVFLMTYNENHY